MNEVFDFGVLNQSIDLSEYSDREKIEILEWIIKNQFGDITLDLVTRHNIHGGLYDREIEIPADTVLTGKIHLVDHVFILTKGDLSVMTDEGIKRIQAPARFNVKAGIKKIGYAHSDVICTTIHATNTTDLDALEKELFADSDLKWVGELMKDKQALIGELV